MPKNIVVFSDGTGNSAGKSRGTNVYRLFQAVDKHDSPNERKQVAFYDDGVGTDSFKPLKLLGGAFGFGLFRNVRKLYKFLVQNYEPGDAIFLFGFSRGAFTVRLLASMVCNCGLLDTTKASSAELDDLVREGFRTLRRCSKQHCFDQALEFKERHGRPGPDEDFPGKENAHDIPIKFIGVWDTVDAVGLPFDELTDAFDKIFGFRFRRNNLNPLVEYGYHALSVDDERHSFHPVLWDEDSASDDQTIEQVWFAGAHSNVGGGLPRDQLALIPLKWMISKATQPALGESRLRLRDSRLKEYEEEADVHGKIYGSRSGTGVYYRYRPRRLDRLCDQKVGEREVHAKVRIHSAVFERILDPGEDYAPTGIPAEYEIVEPTEQVAKRKEQKDDASRRIAALQDVYNLIWWRRVAYFAFLLLTVAFLATCIALSDDQEVRGAWLARLLDPLFALVGWFTPGFLRGWLTGLRNNPGIFLAFCGGFAILFRCSTFLRRRIENISGAAWRAGFGSGPAKAGRQKRASGIRHWDLTGFKRGIVAWFTVVTLLVAAVIFLSRTFWLHPQWKDVRSDPEQQPTFLLDGREATVNFDTSSPLFATHVILVVGERYEFQVSPADASKEDKAPIPPSRWGWTDGKDGENAGLTATPDGLDLSNGWDRVKMTGFIPWRRVFTQPWFKLMGSTGKHGEKPFPIGEKATIRASEIGKLHLFVNDTFYKNNTGRAAIVIRHLAEPTRADE